MVTLHIKQFEIFMNLFQRLELLFLDVFVVFAPE